MTSPLDIFATKTCVTGCRKSRQVPLLFATLRDALQDGGKLPLITFHALQLHVFFLSLVQYTGRDPGPSGQVKKWLCTKFRIFTSVQHRFARNKGWFWHQINCRLSYKSVFSSNEPLVYSSEATQCAICLTMVGKVVHAKIT